MRQAAPNVEEIFYAALEQEGPVARSAFLDRVCDSTELRRRVERLLAVDARGADFLEAPALPLTAEAVPDGRSVVNEPGTVIGPYKLLEAIGEGGMGTVYMAEQVEPVRRRVALKVIKPAMDSKQVVARFEAERQALAMMDHPNIAKVLDGGMTPSGRPYLVMELVRGLPITDYCDQHLLTIPERLELFVLVCRAVQHAHQKGIIHRDLKPSNVLVTVIDGAAVPKVIDFGVAKATGQALTDKTLFTGFHQFVGTPLYVSPEQAELAGVDVDTRSDIYSLGALLYELLTGTTPFDAETLKRAAFDEMRRIIREEEPPRPSTRLSTPGERLSTVSARRKADPKRLGASMKGELDWVVMKALEKDRHRRYETANDFAADILRYLTDRPVEAFPPSSWYRFHKFARRNKRAVVTATAVALAVVLAVVGLATSTLLIAREQRATAKALQAETQAKDDLEQALDRERRGAYFQRIALAEREWAANNLSRMEALLEQCPSDLRGWEWHCLKRLRYNTRTPLSHESAVLSVAFSPEGKLLASGTQTGVVRIWQAKTGQELRQWPAHKENATCVVFSPDGRYLATGSWDAKVKVWDVQTVLQGDVPAPLLQLEHTSRVRVWSVTFSPDGQRLVSAGGRSADEKGEVKVWDLNTRHEALSLTSFTDSVRCVRFSPDGRRLAACIKGMVKVWDVQTGREQLTCSDSHRDLQSVTFSPDGHRIAAVGGVLAVHPDREIKVWDAQTGQEVFSLRGHVGGLRAVAFSPDGRRLASAGLDQTVKLWDAPTGQEVLTLRGHIDQVDYLAFSRDGHQLASASGDKTVRIWDATPVEREPGPEYLTLRGHEGAVTDVAFHPIDGRTLASAGTDGTVRVWDFWSGKEVGTLPASPSAFKLRVAYSPDGRHLAVVSTTQGAPVRIWDTTSAKETCSFRGQTGPEHCLAFSPDGLYVASAGFDFVVRVWEATTGKEVQALKNHNWPIHGVAFSPNGRHLASGSVDSTVRIWDWTTGEELPALRSQHAGRVAGVAFSRDGKRLASASWDRTVKVWDAASWRLLHDLPHPSGAVQCVAFDRDGPRLAWGSTDSTVKVWDGPGTETHVLRGHTSWVQAVAFSPDGKWIASASLDGTVKIWKAPPEPKAPASEAGERGK